MKTLIAVALGTAVAAMAAGTAEAREGCGPGFHRTAQGFCRANRGTRARWIEGHYYAGRGYWYRNHWYKHRRRHHNGYWIYR